MSGVCVIDQTNIRHHVSMTNLTKNSGGPNVKNAPPRVAGIPAFKGVLSILHIKVKNHAFARVLDRMVLDS